MKIDATMTWFDSSTACRLVAMVCALVYSNMLAEAQTVSDSHRLRPRGRTLVEAEDYSATTEEYPYAEECETCSGKGNLGYFWRNSWFEHQVEVPKMLQYQVSLRASSPSGTRIEVQTLTEQGPTRIAVIEVPPTESWLDYTKTQNVAISLPSGKQVLRFFNAGGGGANIDFITFTAGGRESVPTYQPPKNAGPPINPLKGFCSGWWRNDKGASVGFQYLEWGKFEPTDDAFDWEYVEEVLARSGSAGRHVILQFVVDWDYKQNVSDNYLGPPWLLEVVGQKEGTADPSDPASRVMRATDYNHPRFVAEAEEAIDALLDRLRDDPRTFVIQVGVLGFWGEWHTFPRLDWSPTEETKAAILGAYLKKLGSSGLTQLRYPDDPVAEAQPGLGYTNGSATLTEHGLAFGESIARDELWNNGPIHGEWPPNTDASLWKRFFLTNEGEAFINQGHYTTLLVPESREISEKLPEWRPDRSFTRMHRRMGYNFQVDEVRHLIADSSPSLVHIELDLANVGIARFYKDWQFQIAVVDAATSEVVGQTELTADPRAIGPGESRTLAGECGAKLEKSKPYEIGIRLLQPGADEPKEERWPLEARNTYVVLANDLSVLSGEWGPDNALSGGWNLLAPIERRSLPAARTLDARFFPLEGSFRPTGGAE